MEGRGLCDVDKNVDVVASYSHGLKYTSKALGYDADSVAAWIEQNRPDEEKSLVHYVKVQGTEDRDM